MKEIKHFNSVKEMRAFMKGKGEVIKPKEFKKEDLQKAIKGENKPAKKSQEKKQASKKKGGNK